jgi:ELWxxDGT repeat protein
MTLHDGKLYMSAFGDGDGNELWSYDGNTAVKETDIYPGNIGCDPSYLVEYAGRLYFAAIDSAGDTDLWAFYSGSGGASKAANLNPSGTTWPIQMTVFDGRLYFGGREDTNDDEFAVYDAGLDSAWLVSDLYAGSTGSMPSGFTVFDDKLVFHTVRNGGKLWSYTGTGDPVALSGVAPTTLNTPDAMAVIGSRLYFRAEDGTIGGELWYWNGTDPAAIHEDINMGSESSYPGRFFLY